MSRVSCRPTPEVLRSSSTHGVIRVQTLEALGMLSATVYRRCQQDGPWQRLLPGVVALHNGQPGSLQRVSAALLYAGRGAVVTGVEACRRHGLENVPDEQSVHVLIPWDRKVHSHGFVTVERTSRLPAPQRRGGVPVAPTHRAVLDACRRMSELDPCRALLSEAVQRHLTTPAQLADELSHGSRRGTALPRRALNEIASGARSVAEAHGQILWRRTGLPDASWNGRLYDSSGRHIASPDAWCDEVGFAWEIDSIAHHRGDAGFAATVARNSRYATAGVVVVQTIPARIRADPAGVIRELRAGYAAAAARPRPPLVFVPLAAEETWQRKAS